MRTIARLAEGLDLLDRYNFDCPECGHGMSAAPSIAMHGGLNTGHGSCTKCSAFFRLEINEANDGMIATKWVSEE